MLNNLESIAVGRNKKFQIDLVKEFTSHLILQYSLEHKPLNIWQLEAIAYLTGHIDKGLPNEFRSNFETNNFITNNDTTKFLNLSPLIAALQLVARIIEPRLIQQKDEEICGPASIMHTIAHDEPMAYTSYVTDLLLHGEANFAVSRGREGLKVKLNENLFSSESDSSSSDESNDDYQAQDYRRLNIVDLASLVGLRASQNIFFEFDPSSSRTRKSMFGVTTPKEISNWLDKIGYENIMSIKTDTNREIKQIQKLIDDGYACITLATTDLPDWMAGYIDKSEISNKVASYMHGHFFQLKKIKLDEVNNQLTVSLITWGDHFVDIPVPLSIFKKTKGFGEAIVCTTTGRTRELERDANSKSSFNLDRYHPYNFIRELKSTLLGEWPKTKPKILNRLFQAITDAEMHKDGITWEKSAKLIQDLLYELVESTKLHSEDSGVQEQIKLICEKFLNLTIVSGHNATMLMLKGKMSTERGRDDIANKLKSIKDPGGKELLSRLLTEATKIQITPEMALIEACTKYKDAESLQLLLTHYSENNEHSKAIKILKKSDWLSVYEKKRCESIPAIRALEIKLSLIHDPKRNTASKFNDLLSIINSPIEFSDDIKMKAVQSFYNLLANSKIDNQILRKFYQNDCVSEYLCKLTDLLISNIRRNHQENKNLIEKIIGTSNQSPYLAQVKEMFTDVRAIDQITMQISKLPKSRQLRSQSIQDILSNLTECTSLLNSISESRKLIIFKCQGIIKSDKWDPLLSQLPIDPINSYDIDEVAKHLEKTANDMQVNKAAIISLVETSVSPNLNGQFSDTTSNPTFFAPSRNVPDNAEQPDKPSPKR